jgi:hypothetical protein
MLCGRDMVPSPLTVGVVAVLLTVSVCVGFIAWRRAALTSPAARFLRALVLWPLAALGAYGLLGLWHERYGWGFTVYYFATAILVGLVTGFRQRS